MKGIIKILVLFFWSLSLQALEVKQNWLTPIKGKTISFICAANESLCYELCENSSCTFKESACYDCIGDNLELQFFFNYIGRMITTDLSSEVSTSEIQDFFAHEPFISIDQKSPYNVYHGVQDKSLALQFQSLCPKSLNQMIFYQMDGQGYLEEYRYLLCSYDSETKFYRLRLDPKVNL
jgi:hypothetical protein